MKKTNDFHFKTFSIIQQKSAMKVNTDSVILGAYTKLLNPIHALDIGSGTGLLALILAHKYPNLLIDAIEIEKDSFKESLLNFKNSNWNKNLNAVHTSLKNFTPKITYDIIITNPPYFISSTKNETAKKTTARHTDSLSFDEIIFFAEKHLSKRGILSLILPLIEGNNFIAKTKKSKIHLYSQLLIKPLPNKKNNRMVLVFGREKKDFPKINLLTIYLKQQQYSKEYIALTKDFYLNF